MSKLDNILEKPFVESGEIINELENDITKYGADKSCFVIYAQVEEHIVFIDYGFPEEDEKFGLDLIEEGEAVVDGTLGEALDAFREQNWV